MSKHVNDSEMNGLEDNITAAMSSIAGDEQHIPVSVEEGMDFRSFWRAIETQAVFWTMHKSADESKSVPVVCTSGSSDTATVWAMFLMQRYGLTASDAVKRLTGETDLEISAPFRAGLNDYEQHLRHFVSTLPAAIALDKALLKEAGQVRRKKREIPHLEISLARKQLLLERVKAPEDEQAERTPKSEKAREAEFPRKPWLTHAELVALKEQQEKGVPGQSYSVVHREMTAEELDAMPEDEKATYSEVYNYASSVRIIRKEKDAKGLLPGNVILDSLTHMLSKVGKEELYLGRMGAMYHYYFPGAPAFGEFSEKPNSHYDAIFDFAKGHILPTNQASNHYRFELGDGDFKALLGALNEQQVFERIDALLDAKKRVLINCHVGQSRSVTLTAMILMRRGGYRAIEAFKLIQRDRTEAGPKVANLIGLLAYEKQLEEEGRVLKAYDSELTKAFEDDFEARALNFNNWNYKESDGEYLLSSSLDTIGGREATADFIGFMQCKGIEFKCDALPGDQANIILDEVNFKKLKHLIPAVLLLGPAVSLYAYPKEGEELTKELTAEEESALKLSKGSFFVAFKKLKKHFEPYADKFRKLQGIIANDIIDKMVPCEASDAKPRHHAALNRSRRRMLQLVVVVQSELKEREQLVDQALVEVDKILEKTKSLGVPEGQSEAAKGDDVQAQVQTSEAGLVSEGGSQPDGGGAEKVESTITLLVVASRMSPFPMQKSCTFQAQDISSYQNFVEALTKKMLEGNQELSPHYEAISKTFRILFSGKLDSTNYSVERMREIAGGDVTFVCQSDGDKYQIALQNIRAEAAAEPELETELGGGEVPAKPEADPKVTTNNVGGDQPTQTGVASKVRAGEAEKKIAKEALAKVNEANHSCRVLG